MSDFVTRDGRDRIPRSAGRTFAGLQALTDDLGNLLASVRADRIAAMTDPVLLGAALNRCPSCGDQPLIDTTTHRARCRCGWTGHHLRRLP